MGIKELMGKPKFAGNLANKAPAIGTNAERAQFQKELQRFTERFGADGPSYLANGLDYTAALEEHCRKVEAGLQIAIADKEAAESRLKQLAIC